MLPAQEFANAITILFPAFTTALLAFETKNTMVTIILIGTLMHTPVSFTYHLLAGLGRHADRIDNDLRRLDQTMQHVAIVLFTFATSGSVFYTTLCCKFNAYYIFRLWHPKTTNDGRRFIPINIAAHFYMLPLLWRADYRNFLIAFESFWFGGFFFTPCINRDYFGGWGHCVFHLALSIHGYALVASIMDAS